MLSVFAAEAMAIVVHYVWCTQAGWSCVLEKVFCWHPARHCCISLPQWALTSLIYIDGINDARFQGFVALMLRTFVQLLCAGIYIQHDSLRMNKSCEFDGMLSSGCWCLRCSQLA